MSSDPAQDKLTEVQSKFKDIPGIDGLKVSLARGKWRMSLNNIGIDIPLSASDSQIESSLRSTVWMPKLQAELDQEVTKQNENIKMASNITGAHYVSGQISDKLKAAKDRMTKIGTDTDAALAKFNSAADAAEKLNEGLSSEADALLAQIGQFTNGE